MKIAQVLFVLPLASSTSISPYTKLNYSKQISMTCFGQEAVNEEQVNHDQIYDIKYNQCDSKFEFRNKEVEDASNVIRDSTAQLNICKTSKIRITNQQEIQANNSYSHIKNIQHQSLQQLKMSKPIPKKEEEIMKTQLMLQMKYLIYYQVLLMEEKVLLNQTSFNIQKTFNYAPIFSTFSLLASQKDSVDPGQIERVEQILLLQLRENINDTYNQFTISNAASVVAFNNQKDSIKIILNRLSNQDEKLQDKIYHFNQCIGNQSDIVQVASTKLERNQQLWDQAVTLCNTFQVEFYTATRPRRSEILFIDEFEEQVRQRFQQSEEQKQRRMLRYVKLKQ